MLNVSAPGWALSLEHCALDSLRACRFARRLARARRGCGGTTTAAGSGAAAGRWRCVAASFDQLGGLLESNGFRIEPLRHGRVRGAVGHVRTVPSRQQLDRLAIVRELLQRLPLRSLTTAPRDFWRAQQCERGVERDAEDIVLGLERSELVVVFHVRPEAAEIGDDRLI